MCVSHTYDSSCRLSELEDCLKMNFLLPLLWPLLRNRFLKECTMHMSVAVDPKNAKITVQLKNLLPLTSKYYVIYEVSLTSSYRWMNHKTGAEHISELYIIKTINNFTTFLTPKLLVFKSCGFLFYLLNKPMKTYEIRLATLLTLVL